MAISLSVFIAHVGVLVVKDLACVIIYNSLVPVGVLLGVAVVHYFHGNHILYMEAQFPILLPQQLIQLVQSATLVGEYLFCSATLAIRYSLTSFL